MGKKKSEHAEICAQTVPVALRPSGGYVACVLGHKTIVVYEIDTGELALQIRKRIVKKRLHRDLNTASAVNRLFRWGSHSHKKRNECGKKKVVNTTLFHHYSRDHHNYAQSSLVPLKRVIKKTLKEMREIGQDPIRGERYRPLAPPPHYILNVSSI